MDKPVEGVDKHTVSQILEDIGTLLELKGENPFKCRAYHNAARIIKTLPGDIQELIKSGDLHKTRGIGDALTEKITTLVETGRLPFYEKLVDSFPEGFLELLKIPGLGPKKLKTLFDVLGIKSVGELEYACQENRLLTLPGFGEKTQNNLLEGIGRLRHYQGRFLVSEAWQSAAELEEVLRNQQDVQQLAVAGSLRRCKETVKDIDLVVATKKPAAVMKAFVAAPHVSNVIAHGETKSSVLLDNGMQADLRCVTPEQYPFALHHFTGSKEHNTAMRGRARRAGLKMNEYGLFRGEKSVPCQDEEAVFEALGLTYIPPELREDMGEIEAAEEGKIPDLIEEADLKGVFHVHTTASDGRSTLEDMVEAARQLGWSYLGVCDHSLSARYAHGLDEDRVRRQWDEIDALNEKLDDFHLFKGIESDILPDGSLDYTDEVLAGFDFVIASVHSAFGLSEKEQTDRILKAVENPFTTMIGHLTGRLLLAREPYKVDQEAIIEAVGQKGLALEINASPHRLDLDWRLLSQARDAGAAIAINPDAHSAQGLLDTRFGVGIARKGWLSRGDVLNCLSASDVGIWFKNRAR